MIGTVPDAGPADIDAAVSAARDAFDRSEWSRAAVGDRIGAVQRLIDEFGRRAEEMAQTISSENGAPIKFSRLGQVGAPLDIMASTIDVAAATTWEERRSGRYLDYLLRREPVGVVGAIVAWNVPQVLIAVKLAPACWPAAPSWSRPPLRRPSTPCCWPRSSRWPTCPSGPCPCSPAVSTRAAPW